MTHFIAFGPEDTHLQCAVGQLPFEQRGGDGGDGRGGGGGGGRGDGRGDGGMSPGQTF